MMSGFNIIPSFEVEDGKICLDSKSHDKIVESFKINGATSYEDIVTLISYYYNYNYNTGAVKEMQFKRNFTADYITRNKPPIYRNDGSEIESTENLIVSTSLIKEMVYEVLSLSYKQASLFFEDDKAAEAAAERLRADGYVAVPSFTTYDPSGDETIEVAISVLLMTFMWVGAIAFLAFFINLCLSRVLGAFKGDMAIMRSMGIPVKIIRISMYVRMMISLIPAYIFIAATATAIFLIPQTNEIFIFLNAGHYAAIFVGIILLTMFVTRKQVRKLFGQSVKKALKGGSAND
jgi:hypothetical protein